MDFLCCPECGCQINENTTECPSCGCPINSTSVDEDLLNEGKSTEAESTIRDYANTILKWGNILAVIILVAQLIIFTSIFFCAIAANTNVGYGFFTWIIGSLCAVLEYFITKFFVTLIWASIMLFVNISTTLKRIEIKLEEHGTH